MTYKGLVSSDWNECLAPTGPFDPVAFIYPELQGRLDSIFKKYTSNQIPLSQALSKIREMLPTPVSPEQMDAYLDNCFAIYAGVIDMMEMLVSRDILFMINTTGAQGFFQRIMTKKLIPSVPFVAANPFIKFSGIETDPRFSYVVMETSDKGANTSAVMQRSNIDPSKVFVIGDSGGDGPHFSWGASTGACLIGSMTKVSLTDYCLTRDVIINKHFGVVYTYGEPRDLSREQGYDFRELATFIIERLS